MTDTGTTADDDHTATTPPPGPADHGRDGGMATRELAPELVEKQTPDAD